MEVKGIGAGMECSIAYWGLNIQYRITLTWFVISKGFERIGKISIALRFPFQSWNKLKPKKVDNFFSSKQVRKSGAKKKKLFEGQFRRQDIFANNCSSYIDILPLFHELWHLLVGIKLSYSFRSLKVLILQRLRFLHWSPWSWKSQKSGNRWIPTRKLCTGLPGGCCLLYLPISSFLYADLMLQD